VVCLVVVVLFVTIWVKLASKNVEIEVAVKQPAIEQDATTSENKSTDQGGWYISLASFRLEKDAQAMLKRLEQKGVKADSISFIGTRRGYVWHRVRVSGFASEQEAKQGLVILSKRISVRNAWVGKSP
jgi:cell division septation protein DedD